MVIPLLIGLGGVCIALWNHLWNKKESRHEALSSVLKKLLKTVQMTVEANNALRIAQELERSFADPQKHKQALQRARHERRHYQELVARAQTAFRDMEVELGATGFRFPDRIRKSLTKAAKQLAEFGRLVQNERCDAADVKNGQLADAYKALMRQARGWRLTDPVESWSHKRVNKKIEQETPPGKGEFEIKPERMRRIGQLVYRRLTDQASQSFAVHAPKQILDDPGVLTRESIIEELRDKHFKVVFQEGSAEVLSLPELVCFIYELIFLQVETRDVVHKLDKGGFGPTQIELTLEISVPELMRPEVVKAILSKVEFSSVPCEEP